jgi:hypothetical protein
MDYYWKFSFVIPIQNEEERAFWREVIETPWKSDAYKEAAKNAGQDEVEEEFVSHFADLKWDTSGAVVGWGGLTDAEKAERATQVWISDGGQSHDQAVWQLVQSFLEKFRPHDFLFIDWCCSASRPVTDAYGGGTVFISADEILGNEIHPWKAKMITEHKRNHKDGVEIKVVE